MSALVVSVAAALAFAATTGPAPRAFSVLEFNVAYDARDTAASIAAIEQASPDVACLIEVTPGFVAAFEARLAKAYPHRALRPRAGTWGIGIVSRLPLSRVQVFEQRPHRMPAIEAVVSAGADSFRFACVHLFPPAAKHRTEDDLAETLRANAELRHAQAGELAKRFSRERRPTVLAGDLNEGPDGRAVMLLEAAGFSRACRLPAARCGPTFPGATSPLPAIVEIDHILGRGVRIQEAKVLRSGGSDHFPVFASFFVETPVKAASPPRLRGCR